MNNTKKIASGILLGTFIGATFGLLFAPYKGTKSRALISDKAKALSSSAGTAYNEVKTKLGIGKNNKMMEEA